MILVLPMRGDGGQMTLPCSRNIASHRYKLARETESASQMSRVSQPRFQRSRAQYFLSGLILQFTIVAGSHAVIDKTLDNEYQSRLPL